jgi:hypothetical protein
MAMVRECCIVALAGVRSGASVAPTGPCRIERRTLAASGARPLNIDLQDAL